jgi:hypothetical protein
MRPASGGAGTPAMLLRPRRLRRLLLATGESVVALMPWQLGSLPRASSSSNRLLRAGAC